MHKNSSPGVPSAPDATLLLALLAGLWAGVAGGEMELPPGFRIDGYEWRSPPFPAGAVEAINPFGDLRARASDDGRVHLQAALQKFTPEHERFEFRLTEEEGRLRVEVTLPPEVERGRARVDLTVMTPPGVALSAATDFGSLVVNRFRGPLKGRTRSGKIKVDSAFPVELESERGAITARLTAANWGAGSAIRNGEGTIDLTLAADARLELQTRSSGTVQLDCTGFRDGCWIEQRPDGLTARIGGGGGGPRIESAGGAVRIGGAPVTRPEPSKNSH